MNRAGLHAATFLGAALLLAPSSAHQFTRLRPPDVRFVPTPESVVEAMLNLAHVTSADIVYDLGSGDGRIPIAAATRYGARGVGIEIDPRRIREAEDNLAKAGVSDRVRFVNQDLFDADISGATRRDTVSAAATQPRADTKAETRAEAWRPDRFTPIRHGRPVAAGAIAGCQRVDDLFVDDSMKGLA